MTTNENKVLDYLDGMTEFVSPTEIGSACGGYTSGGLLNHSSWASPICKSLVSKGWLERSNNGWYKPTEKGDSE